MEGCCLFNCLPGCAFVGTSITHHVPHSLTGVKLHKSVNEAKQCSDILPVSGAGQDGTPELRKKYQKETPGQKVMSFTDYNMTK